MPTFNEQSDLQNLEEMLRYSKPKTEPLPPVFKIQLRAALVDQNTPSHRTTASRFKPVAIAAVAAALLLLLIAVTPAGQIIADAFLRFGPFTLTSTPSAAERSITATPDAVHPVKTTAVVLTETGKHTRFPVLYPRYLPIEYAPSGPPVVELVYNRQGEVTSIEAMFFSRDEQHILYYTQTPYTPDPSRLPFELGIGHAEATPVMVGDNEGVWLEDFNWGTDAHKTPVAYNVLIWQLTTPDGETFLFWLGSQARLPLDEMLKIAESMAPADDSPTNVLNIPFGNEITLHGFELTDTELVLFWWTNAPQATKLTSFVHWRDAMGMVAAQVDRPHAVRSGLSNRTMIETYDLRQLDLPPGTYTVFVGLYYPETGQRLPVPKYPNNEVRLTEIEIKN